MAIVWGFFWGAVGGRAQTPGTNGCAATVVFSSGMQSGQPQPPGTRDANFAGASPNFPSGGPVVIGSVPATWLAGDPAAGPQWLGPSINSLVQPQQNFIYRLTFVVPCAQTVALCRFAAADNGAVLLNGAAIGVATPAIGYQGWTAFRLTDLPVGTNVLDFVVQGGAPVGVPPSETGLLAEVAISSACCGCIVLDCPSNLVVETCDQGAAVSFPVRVLSLCGSAAQATVNPPVGTIFPLGTTLVTVTGFDAQQHTNTCTFPVTVVRDRTPPAVVVPAPMVVPCTSAAGALVNYSVSVIENCQSNFSLQCNPPSGSLFPIGTTQVHCVAADAAGNQTNASFSVTVLANCGADCIQLGCPPSLSVDAVGTPGSPETASGAIVNFQVNASNLCGGPLYLSCSPASGSFFPIGSNNVTCVASDNAGQSKTCSLQIIVRDVTPPQFLVPDPYTVQCTFADGSAAVVFPFAAADNSGQAPNITYDPPSGSRFPAGLTAVTGTASDGAGNRTVQRFTLQVQPGPKCLLDPAQDPETAPDNWDFELGLTAWVPSGAAFTGQPVVGNALSVMQSDSLRTQLQNAIGGDYWAGTSLPVGSQGQAWIHTGNPGGPGGETLTGSIRSKTFIVSQRFLSFLIGGGQDDINLRVEFLVAVPPGTPGDLVVNGQPYQVRLHETGRGDEFLRRAWWDVGNFAGQRAVLRILDSSTAGHISADDFRFQPASPLDTKISIGTNQYASVSQVANGIYFDWNAPLWGFADMHAHPMSYLGFGGKVMHGQPDGVLSDALTDCNCDHGGWGLDNECGDYLRQVFMGVMDDKGPSPHREGYHTEPFKQFRNWPVFTTIAHQQMWYEWIRRSYDGGLRVMVALCVNNPLLATVSKGTLPPRDLDVGNSQIAELKAFVGRHSDFMEIAYDPVQLRQIVRGGRLAVIIGSELDDIGNFCTDPKVNDLAPDDYSRQVVRDEIQRLYGLGVRYIFTVHLVNNKFGGTPMGEMMLNVANKFLNGEAFRVAQAPGTNTNTVWLAADFDYTAEAIALGIGTTLLPVLLPAIIGVADTLFAVQGGAPPGSGIAIGAALMPVLLIGAAVAPVVFAAIIGTSGIPLSILPLGGNYPPYPQQADWPNGTI
ncbi:MAG TPA: HYR domain-containing protein, partial [Methylomirabilota bacterium]|nr:HYR domain-containing protein [Methylomirabilota bacterium]